MIVLYSKEFYSEEIYKDVMKLWKNFKHDIKHSNRFFVGEEIVKLLDEINMSSKNFKSDYNIMSGYTIENTLFYRARIGNFIHSSNKEMLSPPMNKATSGRCNPMGISYLYLTNNVETAINEVKPTKGDIITIAEVNVKKDRIFSFNILKYFNEKKSDEYLKSKKLEVLIDIINDDLSSIIKSNKDIDYLPFQFLAEYIKKRGYNGFSYKSVMCDNGENFVFFNNDGVEIIKKCIYKINKVKYAYEKIST